MLASKLRKRLALLLSLSMCISLLGTAAYAAGEETGEPVPVTEPAAAPAAEPGDEPVNPDGEPAEPVEAYAAMIGETGYATLSEAVQAALEDDQSDEVIIELYTDAELDVGTIDRNIMIKGNGYGIMVPEQTATAGRLQLYSCELTVDNASITFGSLDKWSLVMNESGILSLTNGTVCSFENHGIYSYAGAIINVTDSRLELKNMNYTAMMSEGAYTTLNLTDSTWILECGGEEPSRDYNGATRYDVHGQNAEIILNGWNQGLVNSKLTLDQSTAEISNNLYGITTYKTELTNQSVMTMENNQFSAIYLWGQGSDSGLRPGTLTVDSSSKLSVIRNGAGDTDQLGAIYAAENSKIVFASGADVAITDNDNSGIYNNGAATLEQGTAILRNGGEIPSGGGIYNNGTMTLAAGVQLYNNHAQTSGDDVYNAEGAALTLAGVGADWTLDDCGHAITGWFHDGVYAGADSAVIATRWCADSDEAEERFCQEYALTDETAQLTGTAALKAAHGLVYTVTYDLNGGQTAEGSGAVDPQEYPAKASVTVIDDPVRSGYTFQGWTVTTDNETVAAPAVADGAFTMPEANVHLTARWSSNGGGNVPVTPTDPTDPEPDVPEEEIPDEDTPQGELPDLPGQDETETPDETVIDEEETPLADAPETGDSLNLWIAAAALSGLGLLTLAYAGRKGKERKN